MSGNSIALCNMYIIEADLLYLVDFANCDFLYWKCDEKDSCTFQPLSVHRDVHLIAITADLLK